MYSVEKKNIAIFMYCTRSATKLFLNYLTTLFQKSIPLC